MSVGTGPTTSPWAFWGLLGACLAWVSGGQTTLGAPRDTRRRRKEGALGARGLGADRRRRNSAALARCPRRLAPAAHRQRRWSRSPCTDRGRSPSFSGHTTQQLDRFLGGMELAAAADICLPARMMPRHGWVKRRAGVRRFVQASSTSENASEVIPPRLSQMSQAALSESRDA